MPDSAETTRVTFPSGVTHGTSTVVQVVEWGEGSGIITAETPFHPVDHTWPDQPADVGTLSIAGQDLQVHDCVTGGRSLASNRVALGADIPTRRGDEDWRWYVVHLTEAPYADAVAWVGAQATLQVDAGRRARLSAAHTACHLMAFALNEALADRWRKSPRLDALGHPDFDALAITSSRISVGSSVDTYRLGKSLRKRGFSVAATDDLPSLADALDGLSAEVTSRMNEWIATDAAVRIDTSGSDVTSPRRWVCHLPEGTAIVSCGGTHVSRLRELGHAEVTAELDHDGTGMTIVTTVGRAD